MNLAPSTVRLALRILLASSLPCRADILLVNAEGTGQYPNIRAAVEAAVDGDEIHLVAGTYTGVDNENISFLGKAITIRSQNLDPNSVILHLDARDRILDSAFKLTSEEGPSSVLEALTIRHGVGAVYCNGTSPTIRNCIFEANRGAFYQVGGGSPTIEDCQFVYNFMASPGDPGGAMEIHNGFVERCLFEGNSINGTLGGAIIMWNTVVEDCLFIGNSAGIGGGAIYGAGTIRRSLFRQNTGALGGSSLNGGFTVENCTFIEDCGNPVIAVPGSPGFLSISNSIVAFNAGPDPPIDKTNFMQSQAGSDTGDWITSISCVDIFGNDGGDWIGDIAPYLGQDGNISTDPLFCDHRESVGDCMDGGGNYSLYSNSPCAPAHSGGCGLIGAYDVECEPSSVEAKSWGRIKGMYR